MTLYNLFHKSAIKYPQNPALGWKIQGVYKTINYQQLDNLILKFSEGLLSLGVKKGDRVSILSENRAEWVISDLSLNRICAIPVPIHTNFSFKYIRYILENSQSSYLLISDFCYTKTKEFQNSQKIKTEFNQLKRIIYVGENLPLENKFIHFRKVLSLCKQISENKSIKSNLDRSATQNIASIVYTSGTTGLPKGVVLTNKNFLANIFDLLKIIPVYHTDKFLSFLPLSHVLERTCGYYSPLISGASIFYAENPKTLQQNLQEVKPSVLISVPRIYEEFYEKIFEKVKESNKFSQKIFYWALKVGKSEYKSSLEKGLPSNFPFLRGILSSNFPILRGVRGVLKSKIKEFLSEQIIFKKIKNNLGNRLRIAISGGAALNLKIAKFFDHIGVRIIEGYGLTETSSVLTCNRLENYKLGTVGLPLPQVEIKIDKTKEILARGPNIAQGYLKQKHNAQLDLFNNIGGDTLSHVQRESQSSERLCSNNINSTSSVDELQITGITTDGWFKTGDLGFIDSDGFLTVIGRKKIMIITSGGKNVNPEVLESSICLSPFISQAMAIGDRQKFISALIVPDQIALKEYALKNDIFYINYQELIGRQEIISLIEKEIKKNLQNFADYEQVKKFFVIADEFTQENNELTPTLKLKRAVISKKYEKNIFAMYR